MKKFTLLAELTCLNKLVNNKVVVLDLETNTYRTYNLGRYTPKMEGEFNPEDYALLITDDYTVVVEATPRLKENYLVNKLWREQCKHPLQKYREFTKY
jgi:hypothetical protein